LPRPARRLALVGGRALRSWTVVVGRRRDSPDLGNRRRRACGGQPEGISRTHALSRPRREDMESPRVGGGNLVGPKSRGSRRVSFAHGAMTRASDSRCPEGGTRNGLRRRASRFGFLPKVGGLIGGALAVCLALTGCSRVPSESDTGLYGPL